MDIGDHALPLLVASVLRTILHFSVSVFRVSALLLLRAGITTRHLIMKDIQSKSCNLNMEHCSLQLVNRRRFLMTAGGFVASSAVLRAQDVTGANEQVRVGLIGCGERGNSLSMQLQGTKNARIVAVCDPDTDHLDKIAKKLGGKVDQIRDYRKLLERKDIDASRW